MKSVFVRMGALMSWASQQAFNLAGVLAWVAVIIVTANVVARYFFHSPLAWVFEATQYILVWFTFLGIAWIQRSDAHIRVEILSMRFSRRGQAVLEIVNALIGIWVTGIIAVFGVAVVLELYASHMRQTTALQPISWPLYLVIAVGSMLALVEFGRRLSNDLRQVGSKQDDEAGTTTEGR